MTRQTVYNMIHCIEICSSPIVKQTVQFMLITIESVPGANQYLTMRVNILFKLKLWEHLLGFELTSDTSPISSQGR